MSERKKNWIAVLVILLGGLAGEHARADAPSGRYTIAAETVRDNRTGLTWQRLTGSHIVEEATTVTSWSFTYLDAVSYCLDLSSAGFDDWRLPTIVELLSLVDDTRHSPAMDPIAFPLPPVGAGEIWSSSPRVSGMGYWHLDSVTGGPLFSDGMGGGGGVRCVR